MLMTLSADVAELLIPNLINDPIVWKEAVESSSGEEWITFITVNI